MDSWDMITGAGLMVVGALLGWLVSKHFAREASRELQEIGQAFARVAEDRGLVEWTRDAQGTITFGRIIRKVLTDGIQTNDDFSSKATKVGS